MTKRKNFSGASVTPDPTRIWHCAEDTPKTASHTVSNYDNRPIDIHGNKVEHSTTIGALYTRGERSDRNYENKPLQTTETPSEGHHREEL